MTGAAPAPAGLDYPFGPPLPGAPPRPVAPGVHWLTFRLPYQLDHVNVWVIEDGDGLLVLDTGIGDAATREAWRAALAAPPLCGRPVRRLLVTHMHPDHVGQAGWLVRRTGCRLLMTRTEWLTARLLVADQGRDQVAAYQRFYRRCGLDEAVSADLAGRGRAYRRSVARIPPAFTRIADGDRLTIGGRAWRVLTCGGHAQEQALLHCPELELLIAADQVLPRISPNVAIWPFEPNANPLAEFLQTGSLLEPLPADTLVLPSHGPPFRGLHRRVADLAAHHQERLALCRAVCREPASVLDVSRALFTRALDRHQVLFAIGETMAHLNWLVAAGEMVVEEGTDGVALYRLL